MGLAGLAESLGDAVLVGERWNGEEETAVTGASATRARPAELSAALRGETGFLATGLLVDAFVLVDILSLASD